LLFYIFSVQINIGHLDANGVYTSEFTPLAFSGFIRSAGGSDAALSRIAAEQGLIKDVFTGFPKEHKHRGH
jgi:small subunit ribosomal protein S21e